MSIDNPHSSLQAVSSTEREPDALQWRSAPGSRFTTWHSAIHTAYAIVNGVMVVQGVRRLQRTPPLELALLLAPIATMPYDNLVIAMGKTLGDGPLLKALNVPRFLAHGLCLPLWMIGLPLLARRAGVGWTQRPAVCRACVALTVAMVGVGLHQEGLRLHMVPLEAGGALTYRNAGRWPGPPVLPVVTMLMVLVVALAISLKTRSPWFFAAAVVMLLTGGAPIQRVGSLPASTGELLLAGALLATIVQTDQAESRGAAALKVHV